MGTVTIRDVRKIYNKLEVLKGVSVDIRDGEFLVLVGPSGCGKSTLLRMIAGLEEISSGDISIGGQIINDLAPKDRDIAMVFQSYALYPHMTVEQNMTFALRLKGMSPAERKERVARAAGILGLTPYLERLPKELSGGQRQRVAMGRAIVRSPAVFLFDEPLSNLDAKLRVQMRSEIKQNHARLKTTTVYVTHDQIEAMTMADRIVVMHDGLIEQIGTPLELYDRPANVFVAGFIGSPAMNMLPGTVRAGRFIAEDGTEIALDTTPDRVDGQAIMLGIRPEHLVVSDGGTPAEIVTVEPTGAETQVVSRLAGTEVMVALRERLQMGPGDHFSLAPMPGTVHLFDAASGLRIN
ncbi:multiple sugar transport system ATP-binding protein [Devosia subaequoris]|uniref:Multiple sugar transport system ATP-binding protein n=1 Tax=Devosia subaequoris TaxID=395930 RepID=A0A7W6IPY6_9HYPH|nr:sn-glycerol-3-phosphate ABC transporter ATP-binding protein UgpC [Devosia subaequoris]MBB4053633.1 multiple sugar transport system ATP-binding protein [Devosia subaequoris]MCP1211232.1 sn-glycerol-3-phosphate ABC transporter ATP-binding protein UgpC [Devosia subaequoris]